MDILWSSTELTRIIFVAGAILALVYKKRMGVTPGGIIVPGILAGILFASVPAFIMAIATALACYGVYKVTFGRFALDKRWTALVLITMSTVIGLVQAYVLNAYHLFGSELLLMSLVVPGLMAISMRRYGVKKVLGGTMAVTMLCYAFGWLLLWLIPYGMVTQLTVMLASYQPLVLQNSFVLLPLSLAMAIFLHYKFGIRGGGYLIAPFIAEIAFSSPVQLLLVGGGTLLCYAVVRLALKYTLIIGLERFVLGIIAATLVITAIDMLAAHWTIPGYRPSALIMIVALAICTNDLVLQPAKKTLTQGFSINLAVAMLARGVV